MFIISAVSIVILILYRQLQLPDWKHFDIPPPLASLTQYTNDDINITFNDCITEREALSYPECTDELLAADAKRATVSIVGDPNRIYELGETISISVTLFDGYGKRKTIGGDSLRASISNKNLDAHAPGIVTDHKNGTYTVTFEALWTGNSSIYIYLAYPREKIRNMYAMRKRVPCTRCIVGKFRKGNNEEIIPCFPELFQFQASQFCNFTYENSNMSWYCGMPHNETLSCKDFTEVATPPFPPINCTETELRLFRRPKVAIENSLVLKSVDPSNITGHIPIPSSPCFKYNFTKLWLRHETTGFGYKGKWYLKHCRGLEESEYFPSCLRNKHIVISGDSTARQWFEYIMSKFKCVLFTEKWTHHIWHFASGCRNDKINFTAEFKFHNLPVFMSTNSWESSQRHFESIASYLDGLSNDDDVAVVICMYAHFDAFHHSVFATRLKIIRNSIEKLFQRNKNVKILIKGSHTYLSQIYDLERISDYYGFVFNNIQVETFKGLHDRVIFMDQADITTALRVANIHPDNNVVSAMVAQMFSYICSV